MPRYLNGKVPTLFQLISQTAKINQWEIAKAIRDKQYERSRDSRIFEVLFNPEDNLL